jgi:hypothetical protein
MCKKSYTVKKKPRVTQAHMRVTENSVIPSGLIYGMADFIRLFYVDEGIFRQPYVVGLFHAWLL